MCIHISCVCIYIIYIYNLCVYMHISSIYLCMYTSVYVSICMYIIYICVYIYLVCIYVCVYSSYIYTWISVCVYMYYLYICISYTHTFVFHIEYKTISPLTSFCGIFKNSLRGKIPFYRHDITMAGWFIALLNCAFPASNFPSQLISLSFPEGKQKENMTLTPRKAGRRGSSGLGKTQRFLGL